MAKNPDLIITVFQDNENVKISYEVREDLALIELIEILSGSFKDLYTFAQQHPKATFCEAIEHLQKGVSS